MVGLTKGILASLIACLLLVNTGLAMKVLVIGGTGRVGSKIVSDLLHKGVDTHVLVRNLPQARTNPRLGGAILHPGDINNAQDVIKASSGCDAIIAVHGPRPVRFRKLTDLFVHPKHDANHPYNLYYLGTKRILLAMEINKIPKLVRLTGSLVGKSAFLPFVAFFNLLLSGVVRWHERGEREIRKSSVDYTVVRCPEILDEPSLASLPEDPASPQHLAIHPFDSLPRSLKTPSSISVTDVASLCIKGLDSLKSGGAETGSLKRCTVYIGKQPGSGERSVDKAMQKVKFSPDTLSIPTQPHLLAMFTYTVMLSLLSVALARGLGWGFGWVRRVAGGLLRVKTKGVVGW